MADDSTRPAQLPASYQDAAVRAVTPICPVRGRLGVAFDIGASVFRLALDEASAQTLRDGLNDYLTRFHSGTPQRCRNDWRARFATQLH